MKAISLTRLLPATLALAFALPALAEGGWRDDPSAREQRGSGSSESRGDNRGSGNDSRNDNRGGDSRSDNRGNDNRGNDNRGNDNRVGDSRGDNNRGDNNRGDNNRGNGNHGNGNHGNNNGGSWVNNGGWRNDQPVRSEWHGPREEHHQYRREDRHEEVYRYGYYRDDHNYFHRHGYSRLDIPVAYYPPAGWCRIWYPGRPAAHQPPPVACGVVVPMGAWVLEHPHNHEHIYVRTRDEERSGASIVGEFRISDGAFVRIVLD